ncbi:MAG: ATP-dependent DNA helicase [bacterium]|nr:ATP-dependent DNA helicase [bacterium]
MSSILEGLNKEQKQAVETTEGPLLIIAGAGTGKTTVITRRIAYLIEKKLAKPSEIIALTFTEKAASEMEERVDLLVPYGYVDTWISTFHAFGDRVLRENALDLGLPPDFQVLSRAQQVLFFQQNLFAFDLDYYRPLSNPTKFIEAILTFVSRCKDEDIGAEDFAVYVEKLKKKKQPEEFEKDDWLQEIKRQEELVRVYQKYEQFKKEAGKLDFGDQVSLTLNLFRAKPRILQKYQEKFKYILVDEYQDTNYSQNELVKLLANSHKNLCVVGDDDQSIYKFRGAAISNIMKFKEDFAKAEQVVLTKNYRSSQEILDTSYRLIKNNDPDRLEVQNKIDKKLLTVAEKKGEGPKEICGTTLTEETEEVVKEIQKLVKKEKIHYKDIAILVRANSQADSFLRALNLKAIPHKFVGSSGLYTQPEIRLLISFLTAISNFDDSINLYNLVSSELYQLPVPDAIACMDTARRKNKTLRSVFEIVVANSEEGLEISAEGREIIKKLIKDLSEAAELSQKENVGRVLYIYLQKTAYLTRLEREGGVEAEIKIQNIARFFDKIAEFIDLAQNESVRVFVDYLEAMRLAGDDPATADFDPDQDAVNVMTVHSAKGLEFEAVFMVGLVADRFPSRERKEAIPIPEELIKELLPSGDFHLQEERRLFYVGSTRAKRFLYYTWSKDTGGVRAKKISPFILEALDLPGAGSVAVKLNPKEKIEQFAFSEPKNYKLPSAENKIIRLSQGSIDDYETCAYKYRYAHVLRLPILRHHAIVYGFALHAAVAEFYRSKMNGKLLELDSCLQVLENTWVTEGFLTAEHEEKRLLQARRVLTSFYSREKTTKDTPSFVEKEFRFNLTNGETQVLVSGRFDRVDEKDGKVKIIDFKSTENRSEEQLEKDAKESIQLRVYTLGYYKNYKKVPDFVGIYDLETGLVGGYSPKEEDIEQTEKRVVEVAKEIRANLQKDDFPANPKYFGQKPACFYCPYNAICPFSLAK